MDYKAKVQIISSKGAIAAGENLPALPAKELAALKDFKLIEAIIVEKDKADRETPPHQSSQQGGDAESGESGKNDKAASSKPLF